MPQRAEDRGERLLSGRGAFHQKACDPLLWLEVGVNDALDASALESAGMGVAVSDRLMLAGGEARSAAAQDQYRLGAALAAGAPAGVGRW
jgi:hypothetical protein